MTSLESNRIAAYQPPLCRLPLGSCSHQAIPGGLRATGTINSSHNRIAFCTESSSCFICLSSIRPFACFVCRSAAYLAMPSSTRKISPIRPTYRLFICSPVFMLLGNCLRSFYSSSIVYERPGAELFEGTQLRTRLAERTTKEAERTVRDRRWR